MMVYTSSEVQKRFSTLLKKALSEGQVKFKTKDRQVFVIRPETPAKKSPFEVRSIKLPITRQIFWTQSAKAGQGIRKFKVCKR